MDRLYLLKNEFADADMPGQIFYCRDCMLVNGLLAAFPERLGGMQVVRVEHPRPRQDVVQAVGEENQWLPLLVLNDDDLPDVPGHEYRGTRFINELGPLLNALHVRHGFPVAHP